MEILYDFAISTYEVYTVAANETLVVEYLSADVIDDTPDLAANIENMNGLGQIGYTIIGGSGGSVRYHTIPFRRSEPKAIMHASQAIRLYVPPKATLFVSVPFVDVTWANIDVSGYTIKT